MSDADVVTSLTAAAGGPAVLAGPVEELPSVLASAAAEVLGADGASLSLFGLELRVPLGASDADADVAERLQFTLGEGPCLEVLERGHPAAHDLADLRRRWPLFTARLTASTPYRSVASTPLPFDAEGSGGAMDLYHRSPDGTSALDPDRTAVAAEWVVAQLIGSQPVLSLAGADDVSKVPWLDNPGTRGRIEVWVAIGSVSTRLGVSGRDALAAVRRWALDHDTEVDRVAADISAGRLRPEQLGP